jgi:hypothetical protein
MMRLWGAACLALVSCSGEQRPAAPAGWKKVQAEGCCRLRVPPGAQLSRATEIIDDQTFLVRGDRFEALLTLTKMGTALPHRSSGENYGTGKRRIDGRTVEVASYRARVGALPQKRHLVLPFEGKADGSGPVLVLSFSCRESGCDVFEPLIASIEIVHGR